MRPPSSRKGTLLPKETNSFMWEPISRDELYLLSLQLSFFCKNPALMLQPSWFSSMPSSTFIGYDENTGGVLVKSKEFGVVSWHTLCSLVKAAHTQALRRLPTTTELSDFPLRVAPTSGPEV